MASGVLAMYADLGAPIAETLFATDASGDGETDSGGFGAVATRCTADVARRCFEEALEPGFAVVRLDGKFTGMRDPSRRIGRTVPFTRIPPDVLSAAWVPLLWGRFARANTSRFTKPAQLWR